MRLEQPERGHAVAVLDVAAEHGNPHGVVHGTVLFAMVDTAMGAATYDTLRPGQSCASIEVHLRFLEAVPLEGRLQADVRVARAGQRVVQLEGRVTHAERVVALATGSFVVLHE